MNRILEKLSEIGIVPVIKIDDANDAAPLAHALSDGGIPAAEVTFRTSCASSAIIAMREACPDMIVGAGTVVTVAQADEAIAAGAQFIVSPGFDPAVVRYCISRSMPVLPGCVTPTEIMAAMNIGLDVVKFFPASDFGGVKTIKALSAPFGQMKFVPTGGVNENNLEEYLSQSSVLFVGGSYMATGAMISSHDWQSVASKSRAAADVVARVRG
ncbi:MAG: bifunctional 4-hydroxy-2-oxoglutarate aldolase/2-dehydro-3-deoxy-phosphogluconate aldolase [Firmicutes bacterium]|nr:bifunctional 4-hydroxy-2-oxoglutarate aldolase/2-dehydro-3-deoxy-phosphogluconate aldolase [Bacillota bacterium]